MAKSATPAVPAAAIPGLTDVAGLCGALDQFPDLARECADDVEMDALCELEERTLLALAAARSCTLRDAVRKAEVLVDRLVDMELLGAEAALLRSLLRDLRALDRAAGAAPPPPPPPLCPSRAPRRTAKA
jgi:hypothetical protein